MFESLTRLASAGFASCAFICSTTHFTSTTNILSGTFFFTESPLTFAAHLDNVVEIIKVLKNGGAHLDFRAKDGMTALHKAARSKNQVILTVKKPAVLHFHLSHLLTSALLHVSVQ